MCDVLAPCFIMPTRAQSRDADRDTITLQLLTQALIIYLLQLDNPVVFEQQLLALANFGAVLL